MSSRRGAELTAPVRGVDSAVALGPRRTPPRLGSPASVLTQRDSVASTPPRRGRDRVSLARGAQLAELAATPPVRVDSTVARGPRRTPPQRVSPPRGAELAELAAAPVRVDSTRSRRTPPRPPVRPPRAVARTAPARSAPLAVLQAPPPRLRRNLSLGQHFGAGLYDREKGLQRSASAGAPHNSSPRVQRERVQGPPSYMQPRRRGYRAEKARDRVLPAELSAAAAGAMLGVYQPGPRRVVQTSRLAVKPGDIDELQARVARKAQALQQLGAQTAQLAKALGNVVAQKPPVAW